MGTIHYQEGIGFRVWAPHAYDVSAIGSFNNWSKTANPMAHEGNGYWSCDIAGVKSGDQYRYVIVSGSKEFSRIDPYAREVTSSAGNTVVHDPAFDWSQGNYQTQIDCSNALFGYPWPCQALQGSKGA
jgi:1,4-alpha-glucan branching enzyme